MCKEIEILDQWFQHHPTLTRENFEMFKTFRGYYTKTVTPQNNNRGRVLTTIGHNKIYVNVCSAVQEALKTNTSVESVIQTYYQNVKPSSLQTYKSLYLRYLNGKKEQKPNGAYAYNPTYSTFILKGEVDAVLRAIQKVEFGYVPTSTAIAESTSMDINRVRATLHQLLKENKIIKQKNGKTPLYSVAD